MKFSNLVKVVSVVAFTLISIDVSFSKSSTSSSSSSSSRSSFSSGSSYSKPSTPSSVYKAPPSAPSQKVIPVTAPSPTPKVVPVAPPVKQTSPTTNSSYSRPSPPIAPTSVPVVKSLPKTDLGQAAKNKMSNDALKSYQAERANNLAPPKNVSLSNARKDPIFVNTTSQYKNPNDYVQRRTTVVREYRDRYPTSYNYSSTMSPNYGHYDSGFLMGLLIGEMGRSTSNNAQFLYANQNQEWYKEWRRDVEKKAEENAELKRKLVDMDKQINELKDAKADVKVTTLPEGIDATVAIAPEALIEDDDDESSFLSYLLIAFGVLILFGMGSYFYRKGTA